MLNLLSFCSLRFYLFAFFFGSISTTSTSFPMDLIEGRRTLEFLLGRDLLETDTR
jgi:hypothetical protein